MNWFYLIAMPSAVLLAWMIGLLQGTRRFSRRPPGRHTLPGLARVAERPAKTPATPKAIPHPTPALAALQRAPQRSGEYPVAPEPSVYARNTDPTRTLRDPVGATP